MTITNLPLPTLQPVVDAQHGWVAMLLATPTPLGQDDLARLFGEFGLAEALDTLPCIVAGGTPGDRLDLASRLPPERLMLRFAASACANPAARDHLEQLRGAGFGLFVDGLPGGEALWPDLAGVVLDCGGIDWAGAASFLARHPGRALAMAVDSFNSFEQARQAGCAWFAGNYALQPPTAKTHRNATRQALLLQLLNLITHDADSHAIENLIKKDAQLSYQLLRLVNSVAFSLNHSISSFSQAITLLGRRQLQRWLQLLLYAHPAATGRSPLLPRAALRAALMEALCVGTGAELGEQAFMAGMFSLLEVMLGTRLADILAPLHLPAEVADALLARTGRLGMLLRVVEASEQPDTEALTKLLAEAGIDHHAWTVALLRANHWAIRVSREA